MELFKIFGSIAINNEQANKALDETADKAENTGGSVSDAFGKIGGAAVNIGKAVVDAGVDLGNAWIAAIDGSREYRTEMGKLDSAFTTNGHSSAAATETYRDLQSVLGETDVSVEAANHLAVMTNNEKELNTWTEICTGVFATFGDSLPIESLTESSNEVAKSGVLTGGLVDALVWAGISEEKFQEKLDKCTTEQQRQDLIMNTLNKTYSKASEQYQETNKDVIEANKAQERLTNAFAEFGRVGEPIMTAIRDKVAEMVELAVPKLEEFIQKIKDVIQWVKDNKETIETWAAVIAGASVTIGLFLLILNWGKIMTAAKTALTAVKTAVLLFNAALKANPIGLVVSLIAGLVTAFVLLWKNNEDFRKFWIDLWAKIKTAGSNAMDWIKEKLEGFGKTVKKVGDWFGDIKDSAVKAFDDTWNSVKKVWDNIKGLFPLKLGKIFDNIKIPKITVSGGEAPYGIAGFGKLPSFNVKWNAEGGVLDKPTIFGRMGDTLLGGGEAGAEAIAPISVLQDYIRDAVRIDNEGIRKTLIEQNRLLMDFLARIIPQEITLDSAALVGALTPSIDMRLNDRWNNARRGNVR